MQEEGDDVALVPIRYDGGDAARHQIELNVLGESLQGMARILSVTGNFAATGQYVKQYQAMDVKVLVKEPKANCYRIDALIQFAQQHQLFSGSVAPIVAALVAWIFSRAAGNKNEMKMLKDALDKVLAMQSDNQDRLHGTLEKMAEALRPAVRQAVAPVGKSCTSMTVGGGYVVDEAKAEAIRSGGDVEVGEERVWELTISELDRETSSAKVRLADDDSRRVRAKITDPLGATVPSPYATALASGEQIKVKAKAVVKDGELDCLYISDIVVG